MLLSYFTEQPMSAYPEEEAARSHPDDHPARSAGDTVLLFSNKYFDAPAASRLYQQVLDQYRYAEESGFDGIMLNEHHTAAFCMQARCNIAASFAAAVTKKVKIIQCGNPLPLADNPVQIAEEIAMIDLMSGGRLVSGIVRGGGTEQLANNVNPAYNRERFAEAHDLIIKTWTTPGPFRWEGTHYQLRVVNPWVLPLQKPHPRIFVPGTASKDTVIWAAEHAYPYVALSTTVKQTAQIWQLYDETAAKLGYESGPQHRGYLMRCHVADTEAKAIENARQFVWMRGQFTGIGHPVWSAPTGYSTWESRQAMAKAFTSLNKEPFEDQVASGTLIAGTPSQVVERIGEWLEQTRPGMLFLWLSDGRVSQADCMRSIELMGGDVLPQVRKIGQELNLLSPFEANSPVSLQFGPPTAAVAGSPA